MNAAQRLPVLLELLQRLSHLMESEGEHNWIRGVRTLVEIAQDGVAGVSAPDDALRRIRDIYRGMFAGYGSFSDYHVWRENFDERARANEELTAIRKALWQLSGCDE